MIIKLLFLRTFYLLYRVQTLLCTINFLPATKDTTKARFSIKTQAVYYCTEKSDTVLEYARLRLSLIIGLWPGLKKCPGHMKRKLAIFENQAVSKFMLKIWI
jgi:hypothetical protein